MNPFSLYGKTILVTGASSGIGAACAFECSRTGATVVLTGRDVNRLQNILSKLQGNNHTSHSCDLNIVDSLNSFVCSLPQLDGVVLCAGVNQSLPLSFLTRKKIDRIFDINFFSQVELVRLLVKNKLLNSGASIVAMASIGGISVFPPAASAYGASKAALLSWMKTAAREVAPKIRINCICPGHVNTPMNRPGNISEEQYHDYKDIIPMKRFAEPEEIAYGVVYLLSDATKWMTGSVLTIDGGSSLL